MRDDLISDPHSGARPLGGAPRARRKPPAPAPPRDDEDQDEEPGDGEDQDDEDQDGDEEDGEDEEPRGRRVSFADEGAGAMLALFVYPLLINLLQGGTSQMWGWVKAKWANQPYGGQAATGPVAPGPGPADSAPRNETRPA